MGNTKVRSHCNCWQLLCSAPWPQAQKRRLQCDGCGAAPPLLHQTLHEKHGYSIYSARYGNIYTARQMRQLVEEAFGHRPIFNEIWENNGRYFDPLRPQIEPEGYGSANAVTLHRVEHLKHVGQLLKQCDILVFTLGLTECWENIETGTVYPVCPGTIVGDFDGSRHRFRNLTFNETLDDLLTMNRILSDERDGSAPLLLLTVSPIPLTATATSDHVMLSTCYSKAILRAVAGELAGRIPSIDYFPSFEIVTNPWYSKRHYAPNLRSVTEDAVGVVMRTFMSAYGSHTSEETSTTPAIATLSESNITSEDEVMLVQCDEELLERFGPRD